MPDETDESVSQGFELRDLAPRRVGLLAYGLVGMAFSLAVVVYLLWGLLLSLIKHPSLSPVELSRIVPPEPRLQTSPETDLARLLARDRQQLASVGWVDRNTGTVHIPVDRAMQILAGRGWPNPQENGSRQ